MEGVKAHTPHHRGHREHRENRPRQLSAVSYQLSAKTWIREISTQPFDFTKSAYGQGVCGVRRPRTGLERQIRPHGRGLFAARNKYPGRRLTDSGKTLRIFFSGII